MRMRNIFVVVTAFGFAGALACTTTDVTPVDLGPSGLASDGSPSGEDATVDAPNCGPPSDDATTDASDDASGHGSDDASADAPNPDDASADAGSGDGSDGGTACVCNGDALVCPSVDGGSVTACALGCSEGRCLRLTPSNLPATTCDRRATKDLFVSPDGTMLDTNTGCDAVVVQGAGAPDICVFIYDKVTIQGPLSVRPSVSSSSVNFAFDIVATTEMMVNGAIDVAAHTPDNSVPTAGPGAPDPRGAGGASEGAGHAFPGGASAANETQGGAAYGTVTGVPLLAGAAGGDSLWVDVFQGGPGGQGGGALQLVSCGGFTLAQFGKINAGGSGGVGGTSATRGPFAPEGAGGGSGGTILIEATQIAIAGDLAANGGGGGSGGGSIDLATNSRCSGMVNGADADVSGGAVSGGTPPSGTSGAAGLGGHGGAVVHVFGQSGRSPTCTLVNHAGGGGGGGAEGIIRYNVRAGTRPTFGSTAIVGSDDSVGAVATH